MRTVLIVFAAAFVLAAPAVRAQEPPTAVPGVEASDELLDSSVYDVPTVYISAFGDGCLNSLDEFDEDDGTCVTMQLRLSHKGHVVKARVPGFYGPVDDDDYDSGYMGSYFQEYSCKQAGRWAWRVTYANDSVTGLDGDPTRATESGTFRVPRCRKPVPRAVSQAVAAEHANDEVQSQFEDEFVSQVRCSPDGAASRWVCHVRHNNTYRECTRRLSLTFFKRDEWGRKLRGYRVASNRNEACSYF